MRLALGLTAAIGAMLLAGQAMACTMPTPFLREGESFEEAWARQELERQRDNWARADGVYLVRLIETPPGSQDMQGEAVSVLKGPAEPGLLRVLRRCGPPAPYPAGVQVIVFVVGSGGRAPRTLDTLFPTEVTDPELIERLREARPTE